MLTGVAGTAGDFTTSSNSVSVRESCNLTGQISEIELDCIVACPHWGEMSGSARVEHRSNRDANQGAWTPGYDVPTGDRG